VDTLSIVESNGGGAVGLVNAFWLLREHDIVEHGRVHIDLLLDAVVLVEQVVVQKTLLAIDSGAGVSGFGQQFNQPFHDGQDISIIQTLDLMREKFEGAVHRLNCLSDFLGELHFLTEFKIVLKVELDLVVRTGNAPAHATEYLVESINLKTGTEIASSNKDVADGLKQF